MANQNWQNLRQWNGSQDKAFEELCCQLAYFDEKVPSGAVFTRKGTPDAGVECFWTLPDGSEWGWQAKFFPEIPVAGQWSQIDESVKTALEKHPKLTKYIICLPLNRSDSRAEIRGKKSNSFLDKWNERITKWKEWAVARNREITFVYWGDSEIFDRLTRRNHLSLMKQILKLYQNSTNKFARLYRLTL